MTDKDTQAKRLKLVAKMQRIRIHWPFKEYMTVYEYVFGSQSDSEKERIRNVWACRVVDEDIIGRFEQLYQDRFKS